MLNVADIFGNCDVADFEAYKLRLQITLELVLILD